jgi:cation:H+ antiporter
MSLGSDFGISKSMLGTFVLAIPTSLPNTWAAMTLARRGLARASLASTFNSNSINISLGVGLPSLFVALHVSGANPAFDPLWLLGMTVVAIAIIAPRVVLTRFEGGVIVALYIAFVAIRLSSLH